MRWISFVLVGLLLLGCSDKSQDVTSTDPVDDAGGDVSSTGTRATPAASAGLVPLESGVATLNADNTLIQFVGTHAGADPNPRTGVFTQFTGRAEVDQQAGTLKNVNVEIQTESLTTPIGNLTTHLKSPDFFDVREYPTAKFESTSIAADASGQQTITGNLTMLGTTKEVSFPAEVTINGQGLMLKSQFTIDRTDWGMTGLQERVNTPIELTVIIGQKSQLSETASAGPGGQGGRGGRGNFDPVAFFQSQDADGDGKLTGDEISERMRDSLSEIDKDGDGAVSLEEFQERMRNRFGRGGSEDGQDTPPSDAGPTDK